MRFDGLRESSSCVTADKRQQHDMMKPTEGGAKLICVVFSIALGLSLVQRRPDSQRLPVSQQAEYRRLQIAGGGARGTHSFCRPDIIASQADGLSSGKRGCRVSLTSVFTSRQKRSMSLFAICTGHGVSGAQECAEETSLHLTAHIVCLRKAMPGLVERLMPGPHLQSELLRLFMHAPLLLASHACLQPQAGTAVKSSCHQS